MRHDNPSRLSIGWGMETRSWSKLRDTTSPPRAATVGGTQPVIDTFVVPTSSAARLTGDGKISSRSSSLEAGPRRTCRQIPRNESAGGARGRAQGVAFDENREATDTVDSEKVLTPAPDEGATFTQVCNQIPQFVGTIRKKKQILNNPCSASYVGSLGLILYHTFANLVVAINVNVNTMIYIISILMFISLYSLCLCATALR